MFTPKNPIGFEAISVSSAAVGPDPDVYSSQTGRNANYALFRCETDDVRWRDDGTDPTDTVGTLLAAGDSLDYDGNLATIRFIRTTSDASVTANYYQVS